MKKAVVLLLSLFSISSVQAKASVDDIRDMTVLEFAEYLVKFPTTDDAAKELYSALAEEYGENKMSELALTTLITYRAPKTIEICNNIDKQPKKLRAGNEKQCKTKMSEKFDTMDRVFRQKGWLN